MLRDPQSIRERLLQEDAELRPGRYTSEELMRLNNDAARWSFMDEHRRLKETGLVSVKPVRAEREHVVGVLPVTGVREIGSFSEELASALEGNASKLAEARGYEGHLAVLVDRFDASTYRELTPVPAFAPGVDAL